MGYKPKTLAFDVEYNPLSGVVYQIGAAKFGESGEIEVFDAITPQMLRECCEEKVRQRFFESDSNVLVGSFPILLREFLDFARDVDFFLSWSCIDGIVLAREAERHCLDVEKEDFSGFFDRFVDLQKIYERRKVKGGFHLKNALNVLGVEAVGTRHVASSDAYNTLRLAQKLVKDGKAYSASLYGNKLWDYLRLPFDQWLYTEETGSVSEMSQGSLDIA